MLRLEKNILKTGKFLTNFEKEGPTNTQQLLCNTSDWKATISKTKRFRIGRQCIKH